MAGLPFMVMNPGIGPSIEAPVIMGTNAKMKVPDGMLPLFLINIGLILALAVNALNSNATLPASLTATVKPLTAPNPASTTKPVW